MKVSLDSKLVGLFLKFPTIEAQLMRWVGVRVSAGIYQELLRGQAIRFRGYRDIKGKKKVSFFASGTNRIAVTSYPLNLHEKAYKRRGLVIPGRKILTSRAVPIAKRIADETATKKIELVALEANARDKG